MGDYKTVSYGECELSIEKSKFLGYVVGITNESDALQKLAYYKKKYADATHVCYAYIAEDSLCRYSDNGEPSGTAGLPMLDVLKYADLKYVFACVVRYFGGIKLGTGGLVRAYSAGVKSALENTRIIEKKECSVYEIKLDYSLHKKVAPMFANEKEIMQLDISYTDAVCIKIAVQEGNDFIDRLVDKSLNTAVVTPLEKCFIEF